MPKMLRMRPMTIIVVVSAREGRTIAPSTTTTARFYDIRSKSALESGIFAQRQRLAVYERVGSRMMCDEKERLFAAYQAATEEFAASTADLK